MTKKLMTALALGAFLLGSGAAVRAAEGSAPAAATGVKPAKTSKARHHHKKHKKAPAAVESGATAK